MKYFTIAILVLLISCKTKNTSHTVNADNVEIKAELPVPENQSGMKKAPCGFFIGMNENQIVEYAKNNKKSFWVDKKYAMAALKTKIDDKVYLINFSLYNEKLDKIFYTLDIGYVRIDDERFKEHYKVVYNMIKELNRYKTIKTPVLKIPGLIFQRHMMANLLKWCHFN